MQPQSVRNGWKFPFSAVLSYDMRIIQQLCPAGKENLPNDPEFLGIDVREKAEGI